MEYQQDAIPSSTTRIDAGKVELDGASWAGLALPFSITQLIWIEVLAVGYAEFARNAELDPERRLYPGETPHSHGVKYVD